MSLLMTLYSYFNIIDSFMPDYMHYALPSVTHKLTCLFIESSGCLYSLSVKDFCNLDTHIKDMKFPHDSAQTMYNKRYVILESFRMAYFLTNIIYIFEKYLLFVVTMLFINNVASICACHKPCFWAQILKQIISKKQKFFEKNCVQFKEQLSSHTKFICCCMCLKL